MSWFNKQKDHFDKSFKLHFLLTLEYTRSSFVYESKKERFLMANRNHEITIIFDKIISEFNGKYLVDDNHHTGKLTEEFIAFFHERILKWNSTDNTKTEKDESNLDRPYCKNDSIICLNPVSI